MRRKIKARVPWDPYASVHLASGDLPSRWKESAFKRKIPWNLGMRSLNRASGWCFFGLMEPSHHVFRGGKIHAAQGVCTGEDRK